MKRFWGRKTEKQFAIPGDRIRPVASGHGSCFATDEITVDGKPVGYMVRSQPASAGDSGWVFMSGDETQAYMDDPGNTAIYDVNTIANYDAEIIPYLTAPAGSSFARQRDHQSGVLGPLKPGQ
jgi:hypothetical protein